MLYCKKCDHLLDDGVHRCHVCNGVVRRRSRAEKRDAAPRATQPQVPQEPSRYASPYESPLPRPENTKRLVTVIIVCVVLGMIGLPALIVAVNENASSSNQRPAWDDFGITEIPTTQPWDYEFDQTRPRAAADRFINSCIPLTSQQLNDNPLDYFAQRVNVRTTVNSFVRREPDNGLLGLANTLAVFVLQAQDETGPLLLVIDEHRAGRDNDWQSGELSFYGHFWGLYDIDGKQVPLIDVRYWDVIG